MARETVFLHWFHFCVRRSRFFIAGSLILLLMRAPYGTSSEVLLQWVSLILKTSRWYNGDRSIGIVKNAGRKRAYTPMSGVVYCSILIIVLLVCVCERRRNWLNITARLPDKTPVSGVETHRFQCCAISASCTDMYEFQAVAAVSDSSVCTL